MKRKLLLLLSIFVLSISITAQKISKPTLDPTPPTDAQKELIRRGIQLHGQKEYDQAISLYQKVLDENPNCALALYEMTLSYYYKKDYAKTKEAGYKLTKYKGKEGILVYGLIANALDDEGEPEKAIKLYQKAINAFKGDPNYQRELSSLNYNLGLTYVRQKKYTEAKETLKKSVKQNFAYASPNSLLGEVFYATKYKIPAFLAKSRVIVLELNSPRSTRAASIITEIFKPAKKDEKGNINIFLDFNAPKDEGDFVALDLLLGTLTSVKTDENKNKTKNEIFADAIETAIALIEESKGIDKTFVGKTYVPFMAEMKTKGYVKYFAYLVQQQNGDKDAEKWLIDQGQKTIDFLNWAKAYRLE